MYEKKNLIFMVTIVSFRCEPAGLNPYFAHFSLEEVAEVFGLEPLLVIIFSFA